MFSKIVSPLLNFFFPPECLGCKKEDYWVCPECLKKIPFYQGTNEKIYMSQGGEIHVLGEYKNPTLAKAIKQLKYGFCTNILNDLKPFLTSGLQKIEFPKNTIFCPVPLHFFRQNMRGFNQSEILAKVFSEITGHPVRSILKRKKYTKMQSLLRREERLVNVVDAFEIQKNALSRFPKDTALFLVDDVVTTGSTMRECEKVLREFDVKGVVVARSV